MQLLKYLVVQPISNEKLVPDIKTPPVSRTAAIADFRIFKLQTFINYLFENEIINSLYNNN